MLDSYPPIILLTLLIELSVAYILGYKTKKQFAAVALVNLITNPTLNYLIWVGVIHTQISLLTAEIIVILVEALGLQYALKGNIRKYLVLSTLMNTVSFALGVVVFNFLIK